MVVWVFFGVFFLSLFRAFFAFFWRFFGVFLLFFGVFSAFLVFSVFFALFVVFFGVLRRFFSIFSAFPLRLLGFFFCVCWRFICLPRFVFFGVFLVFWLYRFLVLRLHRLFSRCFGFLDNLRILFTHLLASFKVIYSNLKSLKAQGQIKSNELLHLFIRRKALQKRWRRSKLDAREAKTANKTPLVFRYPKGIIST